MKTNIQIIIALFLILNTSYLATEQTVLNVSGNQMVQEGGYIVLNNTNFINNGTFNAGTGTILIEGDATNANSAIGGATQTTFYNMVLDKTSNGSQLEQAINISNQLTLTSGNLDLQTYDLTIQNIGTISGGSSNSYIL